MPDAFLAGSATGRSDPSADRGDSVLAAAARVCRDPTAIGPPAVGDADVEALLRHAARVRAADGTPRATTESVLADALALAIGMAREATREAHTAVRRERWAAAAASAGAGVLSGNGGRPLDHVPRRAAHAARADYGSLTLLVAPGVLGVRAVSGHLESGFAGTCPDTAGSLAGRVVDAGKPVLADEYPEAGAVGPVAAVPVLRGDQVIGALAVGRVVGGQPFTPEDLDDLGLFAARTVPAMEVARSTEGSLRSVEREEEGDEAAAELTDHVVGDLFAVGLGLQGILATTTAPAQRERLARYVDSIAHATTRIRDFFSAGRAFPKHPVPLSLRLLSTVDAGELRTGLPIRVSIKGSVNSVPGHVADDATAVVRDALATVSHARSVELGVDCDGNGCTVVVLDDGMATLGRSRLLARLRDEDEPLRTVRQDRSGDGRNRLTWTARFPL